jgi:hypothetical protein
VRALVAACLPSQGEAVQSCVAHPVTLPPRGDAGSPYASRCGVQRRPCGCLMPRSCTQVLLCGAAAVHKYQQWCHAHSCVFLPGSGWVAGDEQVMYRPLCTPYTVLL